MRLYRLRKLVTARLSSGFDIPLYQALPERKKSLKAFSTTSFFMSPVKVLPSISVRIEPISLRLCSRSRMFRTGIKPYSLKMTFAFSILSIGSGAPMTLFFMALPSFLMALFFCGCCVILYHSC